MRVCPFASKGSLLGLVALVALAACSAAAGSASSSDDVGSDAVDAGPPREVAPANDEGTRTTLFVPTGIQCVVATVTGSTTETVSAAVPAGAASATLDFGILRPGALTVLANAYNTACPATGAPSWVGDPVHATVVAGEATQIPIVLHAAASGGGTTITFAQPAVFLAAGLYTTYAVLADGTVRAWGSNTNGEFGTGAAGTYSTLPVAVTGLASVTSLAAGLTHACAIRAPDHSVVCWGNDADAARNFPTFPGSAPTAFVPPTVQTGLQATQLSACEYGTAMLGPGGTVGYVEGASAVWLNATAISVAAGCSTSNAQVGSATWDYVTPQGIATQWLPIVSATTAEVTAASQVVQGLAGTRAFACAILANGGLACWGDDTYGELGTGTTSANVGVTPIPPFGSANKVVSVAPGRSPGAAGFTCLATAAGAVLCSGSASAGQQGNGAFLANTSFTAVPGLANVVQVAAGAAHVCALHGDGSVSCWGNNDQGQLGDGTIATRFSPVSVGAL